mgnify:CR=1 FL=1
MPCAVVFGDAFKVFVAEAGEPQQVDVVFDVGPLDPCGKGVLHHAFDEGPVVI